MKTTKLWCVCWRQNLPYSPNTLVVQSNMLVFLQYPYRQRKSSIRMAHIQDQRYSWRQYLICTNPLVRQSRMESNKLVLWYSHDCGGNSGDFTGQPCYVIFQTGATYTYVPLYVESAWGPQLPSTHVHLRNVTFVTISYVTKRLSFTMQEIKNYEMSFSMWTTLSKTGWKIFWDAFCLMWVSIWFATLRLHWFRLQKGPTYEAPCGN
jgi:hypothetical protein